MYKPDKQEEFYQPDRIKVHKVRNFDRHAVHKHAWAVQRYNTAERVIVCTYTDGEWVTGEGLITSTRKSEAIRIAKDQAEALSLPFDMNVDLIDVMDGLYKGTNDKCYMCGSISSPVHDHELNLCDACQGLMDLARVIDSTGEYTVVKVEKTPLTDLIMDIAGAKETDKWVPYPGEIGKVWRRDAKVVRYYISKESYHAARQLYESYYNEVETAHEKGLAKGRDFLRQMAAGEMGISEINAGREKMVNDQGYNLINIDFACSSCNYNPGASKSTLVYGETIVPFSGLVDRYDETVCQCPGCNAVLQSWPLDVFKEVLAKGQDNAIQGRQ